MQKIIILLIALSCGITQAQQLLTSQFNVGSNENNSGVYVIGEMFNQNYLLSNDTTLNESILMMVADENLNTYEWTKIDVQIYPNPAKNNLYLNSIEQFQIELYDMTGKLVLQKTGNQIDISRLPNGIYIVKGNSVSGKQFAKKLIVQH